MNRMFYYAKLNSDNVCVGFASYPKLYEDVDGLIHIPEYNESYLFRKWLGDQWSQETFEPDANLELLKRLDNLELENNELSNNISTLNNNIGLLEGTIAELTTILAIMQGGN